MNKKPVSILFVGALCLAVALWVLSQGSSKTTPTTSPQDAVEQTVQSQQNDDTVDKNPNSSAPTTEEKQAGDAIKQQDTGNETQTTPAPAQDTATVIIVDAAQYGQEIEARAFVSDALQDGTCTYRFERGNETIEKTVDAFADASTTPCVNVFVPRSEFGSAGEWTMTVTYASGILEGSASKTLLLE